MELYTKDDRAVSEAISYVLIFGLISIGVAIVTLQGAPAIETSEQRQIDHNSENAVYIVQDRLDEMMEQNAPVREAPINLKDITMGVGGGLEPTVINVTNGTTGDSYETTIHPVYVETDSRTILYEGGSVMIGQQRTNESWSMTSPPSWALRTDGGEVQSMFIRVPATTGNSQVSGEGHARWIFESMGGTNEVLLDVDELNVTVRSPRAGAWQTYFENLNNSVTDEDITPSTSDGQATLEIEDGFQGEGRVSYDEAVLRTEVETG